MTPSPGVSMGGGRSRGGLWHDAPGSRQAWEWVVLSPRAAPAPCARPPRALPWSGGQGWAGGSLSVPRGSQLGWRSRGLAGQEGFGWGMSPHRAAPSGRAVGWAGGVCGWGGSSLVGAWNRPAAVALAQPCHKRPGTCGRSGRLARGFSVVAQRVPPSLLLLLLRGATATERDPGPVSAFSFSCTVSLRLRRLRPGSREQAAARGTGPRVLLPS